MSAITWTPERHAQIDIAAGKPGDVQREQFAASIRAQLDGDDDAFLQMCRLFQSYRTEMTRLGYPHGAAALNTSDSRKTFDDAHLEGKKSQAMNVGFVT